MAGKAGSDALRDAVEQVLRTGGMELLGQPAVLYSMLTDLVPPESVEMRALWSSLSQARDGKLLAGLAALSGNATSRDVDACINRITNSLVSDYVLNDAVAESCARGLGLGVAAYLGISSGGTTGAKGTGRGTADGGRQGGKTAGTDGKTAGGVAAQVPIPDYNRNVAVPEEVLLRGGTATVVVKPMRFDAETGKRTNIRGQAEETIEVKVTSGNATWRTVRLAGRGYHTDDGRRGDLVVHVKRMKASSSGGATTRNEAKPPETPPKTVGPHVSPSQPNKSDASSLLGCLGLIMLSGGLIAFFVIVVGFDPLLASFAVFGLYMILAFLGVLG